ncbi:MAG: hypothetical protein JWQ42_3180 [Edaphobacter sp.]|nr:hypothetical protein [Edaphobacter sp.]
MIPRTPIVGERVLADGKEYVVTRVSPDGSEVDLEIANIFLERFRIPTSTLIYPEKWDHAALHDPTGSWRPDQTKTRLMSGRMWTPRLRSTHLGSRQARTESHAKARLASGSVGGQMRSSSSIHWHPCSVGGTYGSKP